MKRWQICIIICLILTGLTACGNDYSGEEVSTKEVVQKFENFNYDSMKIPYYQKDNHVIAVSENGYYFVRNVSAWGYDNFVNLYYGRISEKSAIKASDKKKYGKVIYYYDINKNTASPLCNKADCRHNTIDCEAYFDNINDEDIQDNGGFVYYKNQLYMLSYDEKNGIKLLSYNNLGKDKKEVCVITDNPEYIPLSGSDNDICIFNQYVYCWGVRSMDESLQSEIVLFKTNIENGNSDIVFQYKETANQNKVTKNYSRDIEIANNKIYFSICLYDEESDELIYSLYESDGTEGSNFNKVFNVSSAKDCNDRDKDKENYSMKNYALDNQNNLYFIDEIESDKLNVSCILYKYNFTDKTITKINEFNTIGYKVVCDDTYIYLSLYDQFIFLNKDGQIVYQKYIGADKNNSSGKAEVVGVDDRYVIIRTDNISDFSFNNLEDNTIIDSDKFAVLDKSLIGTGKEEWIEMYNGNFIQ